MFLRISRLHLTFNFLILSSICVSVVYSNDRSIHPENQNKSTGHEPTKPTFDLSLDTKSKRNHYALDPTKTKKLALLEEHLVAALSDILNNELGSRKDDLCLRYLKKYLREFSQDNRAVQGKRGIYRANTVTDIPNLALRMIRRIVTTLLDYTLNSCKYSVPDIETIINDTFTALDMATPTQQDLEDALSGLLRIHFVYGFNASEIRLGIFNGVKTEAQLYFEDCLALANKAIQLKAETLAYQWLVSASAEISEVPGNHTRSLKQTRDLGNAWLELQELVNVENSTVLHHLLQNRRQSSYPGFSSYDSYASCRGESEQSVEYQSKLRCFYQFDWDPYFYINPVKTESLCAHPLIYQFYDFVGDQTLDYIRKYVQKNMTRSEVLSTNKSEAAFPSYRTSMNAWYSDMNHSNIVKLNRRIEKLTGLEVHKKYASGMLQVVRYSSLGGHYDFHLDTFQNTTFNMTKTGDRMATFLIFLSDVKMGGYTAFPLAGTFAKPEKGSAILWYTNKLNGEVDERTRHGGCPVILGTKEIANHWILQYENMFKEPCSLNPIE